MKLRNYHGIIPNKRRYQYDGAWMWLWKYDHYGRPIPRWRHKRPRWRQASMERQKARLIAARRDAA